MKRAVLLILVLSITLHSGSSPGSARAFAAAADNVEWNFRSADATEPPQVSSPAPRIECIPPPCELPPVDCERIKKLKARCRIDDAIGLMRVKVRRRVTIPDARIDESVLLRIIGAPVDEQCCAIFLLNDKKAKIELPGRIGPQIVQVVDPPRCPLQAQTNCQ